MYTEQDANKAVRRHDQRSVEERLTLLRALLVAAAGDQEPIYRGGDPFGGFFQGPPVNEAILDMLGYFLHRHMPIERAVSILQEGWHRAARDERSFEEMWSRREQEEKGKGK